MRRTSVIVAVLAVAAWPCGRDFPNRILLGGDKELLRAPVAEFDRELERLLPPGAPRFNARMNLKTEVQALFDLKRAVAGKQDGARLVEETSRLREAIRLRRDRVAGLENRVPPQWAKSLRVPDGLPEEFDLYLRGAIAHHEKRFDVGRGQWEALLNLPAAKRRYRSTWAAYMLGKWHLKNDPARAVTYFRQVRRLAGAGFHDSLALAAASYGWEGQAELRRRRFAPAIRLYLEQLKSGDRSAYMSLLMSVGFAFDHGPKALPPLAKDPVASRVVTAYLVSAGGPVQAEPQMPPAPRILRWIEAVERERGKDVEGADRLAWVAYQSGEMDLARRWLERARKNEPVVLWLRAKLELRAGRVPEAAALLKKVAGLFPQGEEWHDVPRWGGLFVPADRVRGELGALQLARRQYTEALHTLLLGGYWLDAAYVAEKVLTPQELTDYLDRTWPAGAPARKRPKRHDDSDAVEALRYVAARRLARLGRYAEAQPYLPVAYRSTLEEFATCLEQGRDWKRSKKDRMEKLWRAAYTARYLGMELLGTELAPDWTFCGGYYELREFSVYRARGQGANRADEEEQRRARQDTLYRNKRWHYRYFASDLAWEAAQLMPDESDETARRLWEAGTWLKIQDPQAADRFYKALVIRCGTTELGKQADRLRWFPKRDRQ